MDSAKRRVFRVEDFDVSVRSTSSSPCPSSRQEAVQPERAGSNVERYAAVTVLAVLLQPHASPTPSPSVSFCTLFFTVGQLSRLLGTLSQSVSSARMHTGGGCGGRGSGRGGGGKRGEHSPLSKHWPATHARLMAHRSSR